MHPIIFEYAYDAVGNRTVQTRTVGAVEVLTYTYDAANHLTFIETLSGMGDQGFMWDDNGNLMDDGGRSYTYDQANRLIDVQGNQIHVTFDYNGDGVRLRQVNSGASITYTQDLAVFDILKVGQLFRRWWWRRSRPQSAATRWWRSRIQSATRIRRTIDLLAC